MSTPGVNTLSSQLRIPKTWPGWTAAQVKETFMNAWFARRSDWAARSDRAVGSPVVALTPCAVGTWTGREIRSPKGIISVTETRSFHKAKSSHKPKMIRMFYFMFQLQRSNIRPRQNLRA